jgi:hypothetical protein
LTVSGCTVDNNAAYGDRAFGHMPTLQTTFWGYSLTVAATPSANGELTA